MAKLVIQTQYMENYDVDEVTEEGYWKFKGGHDYIIDNVDEEEFRKIKGDHTFSDDYYLFVGRISTIKKRLALARAVRRSQLIPTKTLAVGL